MKKCPGCGGDMYTLCNACGVWLGDCIHPTLHKDKSWLCTICSHKIQKQKVEK